jgi:hypothetical protein
MAIKHNGLLWAIFLIVILGALPARAGYFDNQLTYSLLFARGPETSLLGQSEKAALLEMIKMTASGEGQGLLIESVGALNSKYCYLASNVAARSRLPKETEKKMGDEVTVFARIHAGIFALARGDQAAAGNYLSAAKGCYWNIDAEKLGGFVAAGKFADAAGLLGDCFSRLKTLLPASDLPAPAVVRRQQEREKTASWNLAADPLLRLRHEQLLELTAKTEPAEIKPTEACPKPLAPQNTPGPQSPRKK